MDEQAAWIRDARAGDEAAFANLVHEYQRPVYNLCYRMLGNPNDAEDSAQDAFLKAFRALASYDSGRSFSTWLLSIAAHHCIDRLRKKRLDEVSFDNMPPWRQLAAESISPERSAERDDRDRRVRAMLEHLSEDYRLVITLRYWHDLGYAEIAEITGDSISAIKSRLHRARRQMSELITADGPHEPGVSAGAAREAAPADPMGGITRCMQPTFAT